MNSLTADQAHLPKEYRGDFNLLYHERLILKAVLRKTDGNVEEASDFFTDVSLRSFYRMVNRHNLRPYANELRIEARIRKVRSKKKGGTP